MKRIRPLLEVRIAWLVSQGHDLALESANNRLRLTNASGSKNLSSLGTARDCMQWLEAYETGYDLATSDRAKSLQDSFRIDALERRVFATDPYDRVFNLDCEELGKVVLTIYPWEKEFDSVREALDFVLSPTHDAQIAPRSQE